MRGTSLSADLDAFLAGAAGRLLPSPKAAGADGSGDFALNGMRLKPERIAELRPAAVLFAINRETGGVVFTVRAAHLSRHPGQIALPGGRIDPKDDSPLAAALRETEEEIGLPRAAVNVIGYGDEYFTGTGFRVTPVVACFTPSPLTIDRSEVDEVFETPLHVLMDPARHQVLYREFEGVTRKAYAIDHENRYIWGVTAGIIRRLYERIFESDVARGS
jgi:8-oxo-dGTP pyrophosphatase MutT (NUDIX family)